MKKVKRVGKRHIYLPDSQVREGVNTDHLEAAGNFIASREPDVVICAGDFADMPSLSTHESKGHLRFEGKRYTKDTAAAREGMGRLLVPIIKMKKPPRMVLTLGNHEDRIRRAVLAEPKLEGAIKIEHLGYKEFGWQVVPFLEPIMIDGVMYCHYYVTGVYDKPIGKAAQLITKYHQSCIAGHQQGRDIAYGKHADGRPITSIIAGSFYSHDEDYLSHQSNNHWRGIYELNEVKKGSFDEMAIGINYLKRRWL